MPGSVVCTYTKEPSTWVFSKAHSPPSAQRPDARSDTRRTYPNLSGQQGFRPPDNVKPVKNMGYEDAPPHLACFLSRHSRRERKAVGQEEAGVRTERTSRNSPLALPAWHFQSQVRQGLGRGVSSERNKTRV